jgi:hypothetical protein
LTFNTGASSAFEAIIGSTDFAGVVSDTVTIPAGFFSDKYGNVNDNLTETSMLLSFADQVAPVLNKFDTASGTTDRVYNPGEQIYLEAIFDEDLRSDSTILVTLDTGDQITFSNASGSKLTATYTAGSTTTNDLSIATIIGASSSVYDIYGNETSLPSSVSEKNLKNHAEVKIKEIFRDADASDSFTTGDLLVFYLNDAAQFVADASKAAVESVLDTNLGSGKYAVTYPQGTVTVQLSADYVESTANLVIDLPSITYDGTTTTDDLGAYTFTIA